MRSNNAQPPLPFGPRGSQYGAPIQKASDRRGTLRRIGGYLGRQRGALVFAGVLVVASTLLGLVGPYLLGRAIDGFIVRKDLNGLRRVCLTMAIAYASSAALTWLQSYVMVGVAGRTVLEIRNDLFGHLQRLPIRYFDTRPHGDLMSRLTNDVERLNSVLTDSVAQIVSGILGMGGVLIAMLLLSLPLTLVTVTALFAMSLFFNRVVAKRIGAGFRAQQGDLGELNGLVQESVSGQRVIKAFAQESSWLSRFDSANVALKDSGTQAQSFAGTIGPLMNGSNNLALALIAGVGGWLVVRDFTTVGTVATFINYARLFGRPLNDLANLFGNVEAALAGAERVFETIDAEPEVDALPEIDATSSSKERTFRGDVVFENVSFSYQPGAPVLRNITLHAKPGEMVALIGPTGAGKTTIVNLLTRFYEIDEGRILIDGIDIRKIAKASLRRKVGIVLQDNYLFTGSVRDNIGYGRLEATDEEIVAAAKTANADAFIRHLPQGYDTLLSERGSNLSQGQRQLLSIARTILANPQILILDEATSSVDTRTERHIQEAMRRLMQGRTSFVIAHRLGTIRDADQILVLQSGEITERGNHETLLAAGGFYAGLLAEPATQNP